MVRSAALHEFHVNKKNHVLLVAIAAGQYPTTSRSTANSLTQFLTEALTLSKDYFFRLLQATCQKKNNCPCLRDQRRMFFMVLKKTLYLDMHIILPQLQQYTSIHSSQANIST